MSMTLTSMPTLATILWPSSSAPSNVAPKDLASTMIRAFVLAVAGSILMMISAKIQIPFWPVPMTMQTFVVLTLGMAYGWRLGLATMLLYLVEGVAGLPVFAGTPEKGIGLAYMMGPTGGYLVGFVLAAMLCGWLAERGWDRSVGRVAIAMILGHALILMCGFVWLEKLMGFDKAVIYGLTPFWAATVFKTLLAMITLPFVWKAIGKSAQERSSA